MSWRPRILRAIGRFGPAALLLICAVALVAAAITLADRLRDVGLFGASP